MVRLLPALVVLFLGHAVADDLSACSAGCINSVFADPSSLKCAQNDKLCVCDAGDNFSFAIRDCITQACGVTGDALNGQLEAAKGSAKIQCDSIKASAGVTATPAPAPATTEAPAPTTTTAAPETTEEATTKPATTEATSTAAPVTTSESTTTAPTTLATSTQSSSASKSSAVTSSSSTTGTRTTGAAQTTSSSSSDAATSPSADDSSSGGLSVAAKAGIGAGAGVALILFAILTCCLCSRKRKNTKPNATSKRPFRIPTMQISRPLPGSGRQYANDLEAAKASALSTHFRNDVVAPIKPVRYSPSVVSSQYSPKSAYAPSRPSREDEHDLLARRYEDMIPRVKPKTVL
ncbi:hypothetical protein JX265_002188 [Neoarthrinium moseri]|uniref:CFEM domain-containing protein n=1 Tax=Neoarthrinium moseri TaxID=1658444 RepID=A0A9Q0AQ72_9PEZI|nr:hypothetical protein JX265_002188 [Neoarthrinium moseri]